jgi:hypothetical protein
MATARPQEYKFDQAEILSAAGTVIDVRGALSELTIFENIEKPYLTGTILITDTQNFIGQMGFTGTERFTVTISDGNTTALTQSKTFVLTSIIRSEKTNDYTTVYAIQMIEETAFISHITKISQAFTGKPLDIIDNILSGMKSGYRLDRSQLQEEPIQQAIRVITPYITPLQAVEWIRDRATTEQGHPYFTYGSLKSQSVVVNNLANILRLGPWNSEPFVFSQGSTNKEIPGRENIYAINGINNQNNDNTLSAIMNGAVTANWNVLDIFRQKFNSDQARKYSIEKLLPNNIVFNTDDVINDKPIGTYPAKEFYHLVATGLFSDDIGTYHMDKSLDDLSTKINNKGLRNALLKNMMDIDVAGLPFLLSATGTVGTMMRINILNNEINDTIDPKRSGNYIIMAIRHTFAEMKHSVNATVTKLVGDEADAVKIAGYANG